MVTTSVTVLVPSLTVYSKRPSVDSEPSCSKVTVVPSCETTPWAAAPTEVTFRTSFSASVSFWSSVAVSIVTAPPSSTAAESGAVTGGLFSADTATRTIAVSWVAPSLTE